VTANRYKKGSIEQVSPHFQAWEFDCSCDKCDHTLIDEVLVKRLETMRDYLGAPIRITSGFRCDARQYDLGKKGYETSKGISTHQLGKAADIHAADLIGLELEKAARKAGFRAVGVGKRWVHVDVRSDKDRSWEYKNR
jgi:uncharacterized protein YcbK (DUF882 family)